MTRAGDPGRTGARPSRCCTVPWPEEYGQRYRRKGYWQGRSLGELLWQSADATPDSVAVVDGPIRLSYRELMQRSDTLALRLRDLGLCADDRIVVQLLNSWEFVVLTIACLRLGVLPVLALPAHRRHEMAYLAGYAEARAVVVPGAVKDFDYQAMAQDIAYSTSTVDSVLVAGSQARPGVLSLTALSSGPPDPAARTELDQIAPAGCQIALFLLSGGTTGLPKLIVRTHDDYAYNARRAAEVSGFGPETVYLAVLPLGHNFPLACPGLLGTLLNGGRVVISSSPSPAKAFALIEKEKVTATAVVPAVAQRWLDHRALDGRNDLSSLRLVQVGGSRLADQVAERVRPVLGCDLQQVYGMGEGLLNMTRAHEGDEVACHTQGRPICPDDELLIVDEAGQPVPAGQPGILLTRGPYTPRGYYRADAHNSQAFTADGWYRTGDIVRMRPDGNLVVEGRAKDMILRGGENISAEEVENFAHRITAVRMAAAVAMPDPELGERVCLYVVTSPGVSVTLDEVRLLMTQCGVAAYKLPDRLETVSALPTTSVGKIDKKALRADIEQRLAVERERVRS
jgi:2,3-dihydroxybenzoate-AMP ligase